MAYSTRRDGDMRVADRRQAWHQHTAPGTTLVTPGQTHGCAIAGPDDAAALALADGVASVDPQHALGVYGADCPGLIISAGKVLAAAHCGWRGCAAGIVSAVVDAVAAASDAPRHAWRCFIGPGISQSAYEVDGPVLGARAWPQHALRPGRPGHAWLDLRTVIAHDVRVAGIPHCRVACECTARDRRLQSFRHDGPGCSQLLLAWREPNP